MARWNAACTGRTRRRSARGLADCRTSRLRRIAWHAAAQGGYPMNAPLLLTQPTLAHAHVPDASQPSRWAEDVKRILCVRLDNLGDVLMTTPALHALRT